MIQIRPANKAEYPQLKQLWRHSFEDSDAFIDGFFEQVNPETLFVLLDQDSLCSMMTILQSEIVTADGQRWKSGYIYGLATAPEARGNGFARTLMNYGDAWMKRRGYAFVTTVPESPELFPFFAQQGFEPIFHLTEQEFSSEEIAPAVSGGWSVLSPQAYAEKREAYLSGSCSYGSCKGEIAAHQQWMSQLTGGDLYEFTFAGGTGVAAVELLPDGTVLAKELLFDSSEIAPVLGLLASVLPSPRYLIRLLPQCADKYCRIFAFAKCFFSASYRLLTDCQTQYFGLGLD
jgi:GNAT superfamily N-acetyltransferase